MSMGENLNPQIIRRVSKEMADLQSSPPEGVNVLHNEEDITDIQAMIDGPADTPYAGGRFHMKLVLSKNFPTEPPKGFFVTKIFHPNVSSSGEICVNTLKKDWKPELGIKHVLLTIKCLLIAPNPESALNEEAGKLLLEKYEEYSNRARLFTELHASYHESLNADSSSASARAGEGPSAKKVALDSKVTLKKKVEKKKQLKRL